MLGARRSQRCSTCRQRKIKCDLRTPGCTQCQRSGWRCPGYEQSWSFVNNFSATTPNPTDQTQPQLEVPLSFEPSSLPLSETDVLRLRFIDLVEHDQVPAAFKFLPTRPYLREMPNLIGHSICFDNIVSYIVLKPHAELTGHSMPADYSYGKALRSLRFALASPVLVGESGTLAAVLLFQMLEEHRDPDGFACDAHKLGLRRLIQLRDPAQFRHSIDYVVLEAQAPRFVFDAIKDGVSCFLNDSPWRRLLSMVQGEGPGRMDKDDLLQLLTWMKIPGIISQLRWVLEQKVSSGDSFGPFTIPEPHLNGLKEALELRRQLNDAYQNARSWSMVKRTRTVEEASCFGQTDPRATGRFYSSLILQIFFRYMRILVENWIASTSPDSGQNDPKIYPSQVELDDLGRIEEADLIIHTLPPWMIRSVQASMRVPWQHVRVPDDHEFNIQRTNRIATRLDTHLQFGG